MAPNTAIATSPTSAASEVGISLLLIAVRVVAQTSMDRLTLLLFHTSDLDSRAQTSELGIVSFSSSIHREIDSSAGQIKVIGAGSSRYLSRVRNSTLDRDPLHLKAGAKQEFP
jgi:hypothetical protein